MANAQDVVNQVLQDPAVKAKRVELERFGIELTAAIIEAVLRLEAPAPLASVGDLVVEKVEQAALDAVTPSGEQPGPGPVAAMAKALNPAIPAALSEKAPQGAPARPGSAPAQAPAPAATPAPSLLQKVEAVLSKHPRR